MSTRFWLLAFVFVCLPSICGAQVIISEIMYNPDSREGRVPNANNPNDKGKPNSVEWVELYNTGDTTVDISGWALADEDGQTQGIQDGATIEPGKAVVVVPSSMTPAGFHAAWGGSFAVYPVGGWGTDGIYNLSNKPSEDNEVLRLIDADGATVDEVNYDDEGDWPSDEPDGASIYLPGNMLNAELNDHGTHWKRSQPSVDSAKNNQRTRDFNGVDIGSPGIVPVEE